MYIGTHAFLPVITITAIDIFRLSTKKEPLLSNKQLLLVGIAGILPDILWPHFSIQGRYTSWTHTVWFLIALFPVIWYLFKHTIKTGFLKITLFFWLATFIHIATDALSGGVSLFYPLGNVIGAYYIPYKYWIKSDITFILAGIIIIGIKIVLNRKRRMLIVKL